MLVGNNATAAIPDGIFILVKRTIAGGSWIHGFLGIVVGLVFLLFAFYFCKHPVLSDSRKTRDFSPAIQALLKQTNRSRVDQLIPFNNQETEPLRFAINRKQTKKTYE
jgi:hypothetical protein